MFSTLQSAFGLLDQFLIPLWELLYKATAVKFPVFIIFNTHTIFCWGTQQKYNVKHTTLNSYLGARP